jgi:hypothetical protein
MLMTMKKYLFFGISSVLDADYKLIFKDLSLLKDFCEKFEIELFLIAGLSKSKLNEIVDKSNLKSYFKTKNIISIVDSYSDSLCDLDKALRLEKIAKNSNYEDFYFKVYYFNNLFSKNKSEVLFLGADAFLDGYYVSKYANVDFVLFKNKISFNNKKIDLDRIEDLYLIENNSKSVIDFLQTKNKFSYDKLNAFVNNYLFKNIIGDTTNILSNPTVSDFMVKNLKKNKE